MESWVWVSPPPVPSAVPKLSNLGPCALLSFLCLPCFLWPFRPNPSPPKKYFQSITNPVRTSRCSWWTSSPVPICWSTRRTSRAGPMATKGTGFSWSTKAGPTKRFSSSTTSPVLTLRFSSWTMKVAPAGATRANSTCSTDSGGSVAERGTQPAEGGVSDVAGFVGAFGKLGFEGR